VDHLPTLQIDDRHCIPCDPFAGTAASKGDRCRHCDRDHQRERHEDGCDRMPARQSDRGWPSCRSRGEPTEPLGRVALLGDHPHDVNRLRQTLEVQIPSVCVAHSFHLAGEMHHALAGQDLAGSRSAAETSGQVEGASSVTRLQRDRLSGIEADTDGEREGRIGNRLLQEPILGVRGCEDRLPRRVEGGEASSPRSSITEPPCSLTTSRATSAKRAASLVAASSPRSCVNRV
jgi:hypothetical protein